MSGRKSGEVRTLAALVFEDSDAANHLIADFARDLGRARPPHRRHDPNRRRRAGL